MTTQLRPDDLPSGAARPSSRAFWLIGLFLAELALLSILYQFFARIECLATEAETLCRGLRSLVARALSLAALMALLAWARPALARRFLQAAAGGVGGGRWAVLHGLGVAALLWPLLLAQGNDMAPDFARYAWFWAAGALTAGLGGLFWLVPPRGWRAVFGADLGVLALTCGLAGLLPDLADLALPLWSHWPALTRATFAAAAGILQLTGLPVYVDAPGYILGVENFAVHVAQQCSGVEGMALVSGFVLIYALLFRDRLWWGRYWLVVLPLGVALSWGLNVLRIAVLILLGAYVSPDLAVNGFHSFAGTLFFTLLALGLMWFVQASRWLHRDATPRGPPLGGDWLAARIFPFIAFMLLSSLVAAVFSQPELGYPVKAIGMALVLALFWPALRRQSWHPAWLPLLLGCGVGLAWVALAQPEPAARAEIALALAALSPLAYAGWLGLRLIGTVLLVPLIEELFFRGYLLARLDSAAGARLGGAGRGLAILLSSAAFGMLHGRWLVGALSGLVFALAYLHRGRLSDAVWCHVVANLVVALAALWLRDWTLI